MNDFEKPLLSERIRRVCRITWEWLCEHWAMVLCCVLVCAAIVLMVVGVITGIRVTRNEEVVSIVETFVEEHEELTDKIASEPVDVSEPIEEIEETVEPTVEETVETDPIENEPHASGSTTTAPPETPSETVEAPETTESDNDVGLTDAEMLAIVIYQEVGGDAACDACRYRIGDIVLNRVADPRFPNTIYEVLTQPGQYGRLAWTGIVWADRASNPNEAHAVERARNVANDLLNGIHSELYGNGYVWQAGFVQGTDGFWCCGHFLGR